MLALLVTSGCGDKGKTIPKADFIRQADQICLTDIKALEKQANGTEGLSEREGMTKVLFPGFKKMFNKIEKLGTPPGDHQELRKIYRQLDKLVKIGVDATTSEAIHKGFENLGRLMQEYGFKVCGSKYAG